MLLTSREFPTFIVFDQMQSWLCFALGLAAALRHTNGYKFLVYSPSIGKGHMFFMGKIADILVQGGHEVVLYQPRFNDEYTVSGTKLARVIQRERDFEVSLDFLNLEKDAWRDSMGGMNDNNDKLMELKLFTLVIILNLNLDIEKL
ncbi:UDP-glucoronosyl and UDP-glucosyl transferase [Aphelenchoides avenae]|nr:UDP-glucoronosyl and UDP-glucosyl transferase [Aphelenchus avenae]